MAVKKYRSDICTVCKLILSLLWLSATRTLPSILVQTSALQSIDVSPNLCHYLWALCLIRLRRLVRWPPCYDTLQYPCEHCSLFIEQPFYTNDLHNINVYNDKTIQNFSESTTVTIKLSKLSKTFLNPLLLQ